MKGSGGCWSCRARRKRCDGRQPTCGICSALHITCHYGSERPQWMDGGSKQEEMAQILKREVKMNAHRRRMHSAGDRSSQRGQDLVGNDSPQTDQATQRSITPADVLEVGLMTAETFDQAAIRSDIGGKCPILGHGISNTMPLVQSDAILLMFYLDNLFPFMFPFYQPDPLATGGKAWVLELITSSQMLKQIALCQSSYFFNLAQGDAHDDSSWQKSFERTRDAFSTLKQAKIIDAAVEVGVRRFIPAGSRVAFFLSEFGCDITNPKTAALPAYKEKFEIINYLQKIAEKPGSTFSYTTISTSVLVEAVLGGPLPDIRIKDRRAMIFDGGDVRVSMTPASLVGEAVVAVLKKPEETRNKSMLIHGGVFTQNQFMSLVQKHVGADEWEVDHEQTSEMEKRSWRAFESEPENILGWLPGFVRLGLYGSGYGGDFTGRTLNAELGLESSMEDLDALIKDIVQRP